MSVALEPSALIVQWLQERRSLDLASRSRIAAAIAQLQQALHGCTSGETYDLLTLLLVQEQADLSAVESNLCSIDRLLSQLE